MNYQQFKRIEMAKVICETVVLKFSRLVKDHEETELLNDDMLPTLEQVAQELVGDNIIVEVEKA